jgi:putative sugar O-methyltransferase
MSIFNGQWNAEDVFGSRFLTSCHEIVSNDSVFNRFKQNEDFKTVIANDSLSKIITDQIYKSIISDNEIMNNIHQYKTNDNIGLPTLYHYPILEYISPGTMYFIYILIDLKRHFEDIHTFNIVEIGSGYGGQAKILLDYGIQSYSMIDISPTLDVCKKYLNKFEYINTSFYTPDEIIQTSYDLVISNWCFSEFDRNGIDFYIESVIKYCKNGYFMMNVWDESMKQYILQSLRKYFNTVEDYPEFPKTHSNPNWLLVIKK